MKRNIIFVIGVLLVTVSHAQDISIRAQVVDEKISEEVARHLETKLQSALTANGYADNGYTERFVLTAKADITQKDISPTTPVRISEKMDITLMVGDVIENKIYATCTLSSAGIGINENKALINAFRNIKGDNPKIQKMLKAANTKIVDYYANHCAEILQRANALVAQQQYDEAIFMLCSIPNIKFDCFAKCQQRLGEVYQQKIDFDALRMIEQARNRWAANPNVAGANEVADIIGNINPHATNYHEVVALRSTIESKLQDEAKLEWDFKMQQYEDDQAFKSDLVDAAKAIGVTWAKNRPKTIYRTIIRGWW